VLFTVMVLPATDATWPRTWRYAVGAPGCGAGAVVEAPAGCLGCGHLPSTAGLTRTDRAVIPLPLFEALSRSRSTLTQLPAVTSVS
jgi:hypothetical protein